MHSPNRLSAVNAAAQLSSASISRAREWIEDAQSICVLTGAGISAESGIPTFRGPGGLWKNRRAEDLATPQAFARDPKTSWEWYDWRRQRVAAAEPNAGHHALAKLEARGLPCTLVTQNVDGLHHAAGSCNIIELHGSIWRLRCVACAREDENRTVPLGTLPPLCACGGLLRPGVVWFGESLPLGAMERAVDAARHCDVFLVCGTSAVVYPAAALPERALAAGARVIEVNLEKTPFSQLAHLSLRGKCGELLPRIIRAAPGPEPLI